MVFSCLEVILKHKIEKQRANWKWDVKKTGEINGSSTSKAIIYLPMNMNMTLKQV